MTDRYGPWTVNTPGECPVPPKTKIQWMSQWRYLAEAEDDTPITADMVDWYFVRFYRVLLEPEWYVCSVFIGLVEVTLRLPTIDDKPDFTRQPKWEKPT